MGFIGQSPGIVSIDFAAWNSESFPWMSDKVRDFTGVHTPPRARHFPALDLTRAIACLWVAVGHLSIITGHPIFLLSQGQIAVDIFIFTSGFLMCLVLHQGRNSFRNTAAPFYARRFFRIAPAFYAAVGLYAVFHVPFVHALDSAQTYFGTPFREDYTPSPLPLHSVCLHILFMHGLFPGEGLRIFGPAWTLSLEVQFYLVAPLVMPLLRARPLLVLAAACGINLLANYLFGGASHLVAAWVAFPKPSILPCRIFLFLLGSWTCFYLMEKRGGQAWLLAAGVGAAFYLYGYKSASVLACEVILVCAVVHPAMPGRAALERLMKSVLVRFLANISYGIYLFHIFMFAAAFAVVRHYYAAPSGGAIALYFALVLSSTCIAAALVFHFLEEPMRLWGRRLAKH